MSMSNDPTPDRRSLPSGGASRRPVGRSGPPLSGEGKGRPILLCAGGTGGHLFPAEALAHVLEKRGLTVELATDHRAAHFKFPARAVHLIPSATVRGRSPVALARTGSLLALGTAKAWSLIGRIRPAVVVGFGGYPTVPPLLAATWRGVPTVLHEQNGVMGRANRMLAARVTKIATGFPTLKNVDRSLQAKTAFTGNPVRPQVVDAAATPYAAPQAGGPLHLLVFGGSQGARVMSEIVPPAIALLNPDGRARLSITQQARAEDLEAVRGTYAQLGVAADCAPFFADLPQRLAAAHLVVSRSGASTVAELSAIGRPGILVPLPHALDQDQLANAGMLEAAGGAICIVQSDFTAERLAAEIARLAGAPDRLAAMAAAAKSAGRLDAAERLADVVVQVAGI
jgi:UDP-N-acetylglucosamine--N-acetylmuramyl-(pentapeptide) pyrophosphoryl-undecaprenol N-acetylglucosamine transferase